MDNNPMEVDLSGMNTPTLSQERTLLEENDNQSTSNTKSDTVVINKPTVAGLGDIKKIIDANAHGSSGDLVISLQSGVVINESLRQKRNRHHSSAQRSNVKNIGAPSVNPHDRVKDDIASSATPSKRGREHGDTPPSANQKPKKFSGNNLDTPDILVAQQSDDKSQGGEPPSVVNQDAQSIGSRAAKNARRNERRKKNKLLKKQNADFHLNSGGSEPHVQQSEQLADADSLNENVKKQNAQKGVAPHVDPVGKDNGKTQTTASYAEVVGSQSMAIIDQRKPGQMHLLTQDKVDKINSLLTDIMLSSADSDAELPVFEDTRLHSGAMRLRFANDQTRQWLVQNVPKLKSKKLWSGANLVLIEFKDIPKPHKFNVVFRNINKNPKEIFSLLEKQNKGISTKSWTVLSNVKRENGTHMTIGVGQDSFDVLRERSNSLFCGMGKANFTVVKSCKENQTLLQPRAANVSNSTVTATTSQLTNAKGQSTSVEGNDTPISEAMTTEPPELKQ